MYISRTFSIGFTFTPKKVNPVGKGSPPPCGKDVVSRKNSHHSQKNDECFGSYKSILYFCEKYSTTISNYD